MTCSSFQTNSRWNRWNTGILDLKSAEPPSVKLPGLELLWKMIEVFRMPESIMAAPVLPPGESDGARADGGDGRELLGF
jgi:hypothetical protein